MSLGTVKDVFSEGFVSVREDDTLSNCLSHFKEKRLSALAVLDSKGKYRGVLSRKWVVRSVLDPSTTKVERLMRSAPKVTLNDSLTRVAKLMIESGVMQLPVFNGEKLLGFVTDEDVIQDGVFLRS